MVRRERVAGAAAAFVLVAAVVTLIVRSNDDSDDVATDDRRTTSTTSTLRPSTSGTLAPGTTSTTVPGSSTTGAAPGLPAGETTTTTAAAVTEPPPADPTPPGLPTAPPLRADVAGDIVRLTAIASGLDQPVAAAARPAHPGVLYVAGRSGLVYLVQPGASPQTLLDIRAEVSTEGERGLLGIAVSADGGTLAISYTDTSPVHANQLHRFSLGPDGAINVASRQLLGSVPHPSYDNHNGGAVVFGPDGMLYWALGDGGGAGDPFGYGQNLDSLQAKLVRVDPTTGQATVAHYGLRNPWRFSFDRATNDLWIADVGQNQYEEINWWPAGAPRANFEWSLREGLHPYNGGARPADGVQPVWEYPHGPRCSITGGYLYRGAKIPGLVGTYLFSDFCVGDIKGLVQAGERSLGVSVPSVASFAEDAAGELYVLSFTGTVHRIDPA